jgi:menaquinone-dependent protoporphyrinogen IX oxidase
MEGDMKAVVIYRSISGFTKRYAEWIAEELGADLFDSRKAWPESLSAYDVVVFGGNLHAVGINGVDALKRRLAGLAGKRIIVFATGASPARDAIPDEVLDANFSPEERGMIRFFYLRGGFDFRKLDFPNKVLMTLLKWRILMKKEADRDLDDRGMLAAFARPVDFAKKENIRPLVGYARFGTDALSP